MKQNILLFLFCLPFTCLLAQQPLNFDFEKMSVEGAARPWGWAQWQSDVNTIVYLDSVEVKNGSRALCFSSAQNRSGETALAYWFSPYAVKGKNLRLNGWIKTDKTQGEARIILWAISDTGWIKIAESPAFQGQNPWKSWTLEGLCDAEVHSWYLVLSVTGDGTTHFDDIRLFVDHEVKSTLEIAPDFSISQRYWLDQHVRTFSQVEPVKGVGKADFSDLRAFKKSVGEARIIALGEATHGTSEFFLLKHRLLQFAIQELDVRVFAIEANQLEVEKVNRFVCRGEGSAESSIKSMFRVWNTEEMLELIRWLRAYNLKHPNRQVEFVGFDCQDPSLPMDSIAQFIAAWEPELLPLVSNLQQNYRSAWKAQYYPQAPDSIRALWKANAEKVLELVENKKQQWLEAKPSDAAKNRIEWAHQNARVVYQAAEVAWTNQASARDTFMAENIRWLQQQRGPASRVIVWAHDSHIARSDHPDKRFNYHNGDSMGKYLSRMYGNKYRAYGLFTGEGQYSAVISYRNHKVVPVEGMIAPRGSFDEALSRIAASRTTGQLFLDLKPALKLSTNSWLTQPRPVRFVGYAANDFDFGAVMSVPFQFDGIFFVKKSHASRMTK